MLLIQTNHRKQIKFARVTTIISCRFCCYRNTCPTSGYILLPLVISIPEDRIAENLRPTCVAILKIRVSLYSELCALACFFNSICKYPPTYTHIHLHTPTHTLTHTHKHTIYIMFYYVLFVFYAF